MEREVEGRKEEVIYKPKPVEFEETYEDKIVEDVLSMPKEAQEDFCDELLEIVTTKRADMSANEKNTFMQLIKGHYTHHTLRSALRVAMRSDLDATRRLIDKTKWLR